MKVQYDNCSSDNYSYDICSDAIRCKDLKVQTGMTLAPATIAPMTVALTVAPTKFAPTPYNAKV